MSYNDFLGLLWFWRNFAAYKSTEHKVQITPKIFPFDDVIMYITWLVDIAFLLIQILNPNMAEWNVHVK